MTTLETVLSDDTASLKTTGNYISHRPFSYYWTISPGGVTLRITPLAVQPLPDSAPVTKTLYRPILTNDLVLSTSNIEHY